MSSLEPFVKAYRDTVASERMSSSRVDKIRSEATRQFHQSHALVSAIKREHCDAHGKTSLSSLYLFDAVCRHAQDIVRKRASGFDYKNADAPRGSSAERGTKQALVEGAQDFLESSIKAVDDIVIATLDEIRSDQKDKVSKVVEIWRKAGTFDDDVVRRLHQHVNQESNARGAGREEGNTMPSPYGRIVQDENAGNGRSSSAEAVKEAAASKAASMPNVPSSILAMLGGNERSRTNEQTPAQRDQPEAPKSLDPNQLEALRRFASTQQPQDYKREEQRQHSPATAPPPSGPPIHPDRLRQLENQGRAPPSSEPLRSASNQTSQTPPAPKINADYNDQNESGFVPDQSVGDLSQFDFSTFDPSTPASWLRFAQQWHNTYQYIPTNQELFGALISGMQAQMYMQAQQMMSGGYDASGTQVESANDYSGYSQDQQASYQSQQQQQRNW